MASLFRTVRSPLILASSSPRRRALLSEAGICFTVLAPDDAVFSEPGPECGELPSAYTVRAATAKARAVACTAPGCPVIGADTVVVTPGGHILGKPSDEKNAVEMLSLLVGRTHTVVTGCCVIMPWNDAGMVSFADETRVTFGNWDISVLTAYARGGEPSDKAGAYAIQGQGAFLAEKIEGSWSTVVGLPVPRLLRILLENKIIDLCI